MAKNLVIVESPAKAGTIEKYLGKDYQVVASMGHVRDLPESKLGVDVENQFAPDYIIPIRSRKTVKLIKAALKGKEKVLLATDLDREGEAIAWHIKQVLELSDDFPVERITFDEITKTAIQEAIKNPRQINQQLVDAQQARRVLDRLVGYTLSPVLWKKIYKGLSAGRVQSAALRLIVDREKERDDFKPVEYWSINAILSQQKAQDSFTAQLIAYNEKKIGAQDLHTETEARAIEADLKSQSYIVEKIEAKEAQRRPSAPYTTSTFQQDAVNKLGMSAKRAMRTAQGLYESGHITYMRTDSVDLAASALQAIRAHIKGRYGAAYLPDKPNYYKSSNKKAQEAHEAIRPTDPAATPEQISKDPIAQKVYGLIHKRALASQMAPAKLLQTAVDIKAGKGLFRANGQEIIFPGFLTLWNLEDKEANFMPKLTVGEVLNLIDLLSEQHFTEPPPRFSEATLIKALEEQGIGRPSTYSPIIDTLIQRRYVTLDQRRFTPETVGKLVIDLLKNYFPEIVDLHFTAEMEERLDDIADGTADYVSIVKSFWEPLNEQIKNNVDKIEKVNTTEETDALCPNCQAPMVIKMGRFGRFMACSRFPECKTTQPLNSAAPSGLLCPICGKPLIQKRARRSSFFGCSGYPECKFAIWKKEDLPKKIGEQEKEGVALPHKEESLKALQELPTEVKPE